MEMKAQDLRGIRALEAESTQTQCQLQPNVRPTQTTQWDGS
jgi:hypothetical protein